MSDSKCSFVKSLTLLPSNQIRICTSIITIKSSRPSQVRANNTPVDLALPPPAGDLLLGNRCTPEYRQLYYLGGQTSSLSSHKTNERKWKVNYLVYLCPLSWTVTGCVWLWKCGDCSQYQGSGHYYFLLWLLFRSLNGNKMRYHVET